ncbi:MAG TPA: UDP-N-acetylglucosamine 2-epimerase (non-hydrolyzing) [Candidatus Bathyarchaeia archaeon]|nr:UDP-N-acetylglucosamine 2-epimerase (non-hydrolyzing) [Candidatus Bathyarchaeia archaeon]
MVVVGTRPEIIKMAPIIRALSENSLPFVFVHCGQHYDYNMSQQFIEELELPRPDYGFEVKTRLQGIQTARILTVIERVVSKVKPRVVLVEGDTNATLASALAALKLNFPVGHVEAGLRSFDLRMPEEHNRRLVDHMSTFLFAPTTVAEKNLLKENVWGEVYVTGNTVIDAVMQHIPLAEKKSTIMDRIRFKNYALATAHRAENVDDPAVLKDFSEAFKEAPIPVVYPIHPRSRKRLRQAKMLKQLSKSRNVQVLQPVGYFDFLVLMKNCDLIITDSGGIQEEATVPILRKPTLVIRISTERPEAVEAGFAKVVGVKKQNILTAMEQTLEEPGSMAETSPYGDGTAGRKIAKILLDRDML